MNVQQFVGNSMRDALAQVRSALGEDALILATEETSQGFQVSAVAEAPGGMTPGFGKAANTHREKDQAVDNKVATASDVGKFDEALQSVNNSLATQEEVREEMNSIRSLVESHLAHVGWKEAFLGSPLTAAVMRNLSALGIAPDIVCSLLEEIDATKLRGQTWAAPMKLLEGKLPVVDVDLKKTPRIAVIGPTGAGKTTAVAKLAARHAIDNSAESLEIVSLDNHRLGSSEQIDALGRLLGVAVKRPVGDRGLADISTGAQTELTLIDTVGLGQHDSRISEQMNRLGEDVCSFLVLPANLEHDAMQEVIEAFAVCKPAGIILSKVDEAATLGAAISVVLRSGMPLAWISDGERIPEDLHDAVVSQAWLIKRAAELMRKRSVSVSERYMAENFYGVGGQEVPNHG